MHALTFWWKTLQLKSSKWEVSSAAALALGNSGDVRAIPHLIAALGNEKTYGNREASKAIVKFGQPAVELLIVALRSKERNMMARGMAAEALGEIGDRRAVASLLEALNDGDEYVRRCVADALGCGGEPDGEPLARKHTWSRWSDSGSACSRSCERCGRKETAEIRGRIRWSLGAYPKTCYTCDEKLEYVAMSYGAMTIGKMPALLGGVICNSCGRLVCSDCKGTPVEDPCTACGGAVSPAYENVVDEIKNRLF